MRAQCADCMTHACYTKGVNCTGVSAEEVRNAYTEEELKMMEAAAYVEGTFYSNITRLQEIAEFAKAMGYKKLGLAFCIGLNEEARYISHYYVNQGFEVYSVCCKNCSFAKKEFWLETSQTGIGTRGHVQSQISGQVFGRAGNGVIHSLRALRRPRFCLYRQLSWPGYLPGRQRPAAGP